MNRLLKTLIVLGIGLSASQLSAEPGEEKSFETSADQKLNYLLHLPKGYADDESKKWPVMLFLHGAGERGDDLAKVKVHGPPNLADADWEQPFIVISPQCPNDQWWTWHTETLLGLIDSVIESHRVDEDRVYLTGLSMGGYGSWALASRYPEKFAAVAPICGGGTPYMVRRMADLPIWVFHGAKDGVVPLSESWRLVETLKKSGAEKVEFTIYPEAGHNSWTESYDNPKLYEWFLSHKRGE
ncbi:MAG: putative peptidase [Verrucomicrobiales bacterium]|jgi:predicted peptidase